jgi:hypothetical protein
MDWHACGGSWSRSQVPPVRSSVIQPSLRAGRLDSCAPAPGGGGGGPLGGLLGGEEAVLRDPARERAAAQAGIPYTLVRTGPLRSIPAGAGDPRVTEVPHPRVAVPGHDMESSALECASFACASPTSTHMVYACAADVEPLGDVVQSMCSTAINGEPLPGVQDPVNTTRQAHASCDRFARLQHGWTVPILLFLLTNLLSGKPKCRVLALSAGRGARGRRGGRRQPRGRGRGAGRRACAARRRPPGARAARRRGRRGRRGRRARAGAAAGLAGRRWVASVTVQGRGLAAATFAPA